MRCVNNPSATDSLSLRRRARWPLAPPCRPEIRRRISYSFSSYSGHASCNTPCEQCHDMKSENFFFFFCENFTRNFKLQLEKRHKFFLKLCPVELFIQKHSQTNSTCSRQCLGRLCWALLRLPPLARSLQYSELQWKKKESAPNWLQLDLGALVAPSAGA